MRLNKTDGLTLGFVLTAVILILLNGYLKRPDKPQLDLVDSSRPGEIIEQYIEIEPPPNDILNKDGSEPEIIYEPTPITFSKAFADARQEKGPGAIFEWNGNTYTTSYAEEIVKPGEKLDSTRINLVHNQSPEK